MFGEVGGDTCVCDLARVWSVEVRVVMVVLGGEEQVFGGWRDYVGELAGE